MNTPVEPQRIKKLPIIVASVLGLVVLATYIASTFVVPPSQPAPPAVQATATPAGSFYITPYNDVQPAASGSQNNAVTVGLVFDFMWKFALVLIMIYATVLVLRKIKGRATAIGGSAGSATVNVLDTVHLAQNKVIYLIEVGQKVLVVGSTPQSMSTLTELTDADTVAGLRDNARPPRGNEPFSKYLNYFSSRSQPVPAMPDRISGSRTMVDNTLSQLKRLVGRE